MTNENFSKYSEQAEKMFMGPTRDYVKLAMDYTENSESAMYMIGGIDEVKKKEADKTEGKKAQESPASEEESLAKSEDTANNDEADKLQDRETNAEAAGGEHSQHDSDTSEAEKDGAEKKPEARKP
ncbi:MAG: hypothetical protein R6V12_01680 [Candidatus Hydrogenedentota bacterium]